MGLAGSLYLMLDYNLEHKHSDRTCRTCARTDRLVEERRRSGLKVTIHPKRALMTLDVFAARAGGPTEPGLIAAMLSFPLVFDSDI